MNDCETCLEITKRPAGFYDRQMADGTLQGGVIYNCDSKTCPVALEAQALHERAMAEQRMARKINAENGITPSNARQDRIDAEITTLAMSRMLDVNPALVCDWERERKPWPVDMFKRYMAIIAEKEEARR